MPASAVVLWPALLCRPVRPLPRPSLREISYEDNSPVQFEATHIGFGVNLHLGHHIIELHVLFPDTAAVLDGLYTLPQVVRRNGSRFDGGFGDECDRGVGYKCLQN